MAGSSSAMTKTARGHPNFSNVKQTAPHKRCRQKIVTILFIEMNSFHEGEAPMRIAQLIFVGSVTALAVLTAPALAKHSGAPKTDDSSASSSCHARQQVADGSWTEIPCQEVGASGQTQHKSATENEGEEKR
jgi:hypothetical protein